MSDGIDQSLMLQANAMYQQNIYKIINGTSYFYVSMELN